MFAELFLIHTLQYSIYTHLYPFLLKGESLYVNTCGTRTTNWGRILHHSHTSQKWFSNLASVCVRAQVNPAYSVSRPLLLFGPVSHSAQHSAWKVNFNPKLITQQSHSTELILWHNVQHKILFIRAWWSMFVIQSVQNTYTICLCENMVKLNVKAVNQAKGHHHSPEPNTTYWHCLLLYNRKCFHGSSRRGNTPKMTIPLFSTWQLKPWQVN